MPVNITSVDEALEDNGLKCCVHGPSGAGKTVLCATAKAPTLIINTEGGLLSLEGAPDYIQTAKITTLPDLYELYGMLNAATQENKRVYEWICLDSCSEIAEVVLAHEKSISADPRQAYGALITEMLKLIKAFRDMPQYNVLMTFKQARVTDKHTGMTTYGPSLPGSKLDNEIPYLFDEVFALRVEHDEEVGDYRVLQTSRDVQYEAKDRSGKLAMFEEPKLHSLFTKIYGD